jgi:hypothetical protein
MRASLLALLLLLSGCGYGLANKAPFSEPPQVEAQSMPAPAPRVFQSLIVAQPAPSPLPTIIPPPPTATPPPKPPLLQGEPAPLLGGNLAMRTYSLDFYRLNGGMEAATIQALGMLVEHTVITGSHKIGAFLTGRVAISFEPPQTGPCAIRGLTLSNQRTIRLFYEPSTDPNRVLAILAHETFHQLQHDYYGETAHRRSDIILLEGMAVWGSQDYFRAADGWPLYHHRSKEALLNGALLPLTTSLEADCRTTTRNNIYNQWASFVEYLLATYGRDRLDAVYRDSTGRAAGSANYQGVYGKPLAALEAEWVAWLSNQP